MKHLEKMKTTKLITDIYEPSAILSASPKKLPLVLTLWLLFTRSELMTMDIVISCRTSWSAVPSSDVSVSYFIFTIWASVFSFGH